MLSVTDGLFRETVRAVPRQESGRYDDVIVAEQLVDSAVYRWALPYALHLRSGTSSHVIKSDCSGNHSMLDIVHDVSLHDANFVSSIYDVMVAPNLYGDILSYGIFTLVCILHQHL